MFPEEMKRYLAILAMTALSLAFQSKLLATCIIPVRQSGLESKVFEISQKITVRILVEGKRASGGSGIIISRQGSTYTALTNLHTVRNSSTPALKILAPDGSIYTIDSIDRERFDSLDLAIVRFSSDREYSIATIGSPSSISQGINAFASGYPGRHYTYRDGVPVSVESTVEWGQRAFCFTSGKVEALGIEGLGNGYQMGYSNIIQKGMSGGPILNSRGELIGVNGALPFSGQHLSELPQHAIAELEPLSWGIPINLFVDKLN